MAQKEGVISVRVDTDLKDDMVKISDELLVTIPSLVTGSLQAIREFYRKHRYLPLPLRVIPESEYNRLLKAEKDLQRLQDGGPPKKKSPRKR
ncbi:MAG: hypothetical protein AAF357_00260 [Verrucomicrobiota bacterium]